jgi:hypothetical protein
MVKLYFHTRAAPAGNSIWPRGLCLVFGGTDYRAEYT